MRKLILLSVLFFLSIFINLSAQQDWNWRSPNPQGNQIDKIFLGNNTIFGLGYCSTIIASSNAGSEWKVMNAVTGGEDIFTAYQKFDENLFFVGTKYNRFQKTSNGGANWTNGIASIPSGSGISGIYFTSPSIGYVSSGNKIFKTTNSGSQWSLIKTVIDPIFSLYFLNSYTGFVTTSGGMEGGVSTMFKTTDGGANWQSTSFGSWSTIFKILKFTNENSGLLLYGGKLHKTTNQGLNWNIVSNENIENAFVLNENDIVGYYQNSFKTSTNGGLSYTVKTLHAQWRYDMYFESLQKGYILEGNNLISFTENGGDTWRNITERNGSGTASNRVLAMKFVNNNTGYSGGWNNYFKKTTDQGETWVDYPAGMTGHIYDMHFLDENTGYITGGNSSQTFLRKTTNGGLNFTQIYMNSISTGTGVEFLNNNTGYLMGHSYFMRTTNGGANWINVSFGDSVKISGCDFVNETTGFVTGTINLRNTNKLFKTTDAGLSWRTVYSIESYIWRVKMTDNLRGYIAGSKIHKTTDAGETWQVLHASPYSSNIEFINNETGYACGTYGSIFRTTNGGAHWATGSTPTAYDIYGIKFFDNNIGIISGENGVILKTYNGGGIFLTGISPVNNYIVSGYKLHQNYPNPFNPVTNIQFDLPKNQFVKIKVYDLLGKEAASLVNEYKTAGSYLVSFDGANLSSGVYFYKIETTDFIQTKRMILMK